MSKKHWKDLKDMKDVMWEDVISIGANCIFSVGNRFFLLVEIEVEADDVEIEEFVFIRISRQEAKTLLNAGVDLCTISRRVPDDADFVCVLIVGGQAFALFEVEDDMEEAVLVPISLRTAKRLIRNGARKCTVIDKFNH